MVFLDASAVIYLLEGEPGLRQATQDVLAAAGTRNAAPAIAVLALSLLECRVHPLHSADGERVSVFDSFFEDPGLIVVELDRRVIDQATELRARHGIRTPDALQAASCIALHPDTPFVTGDRDFRRVPGLNVHLIA